MRYITAVFLVLSLLSGCAAMPVGTTPQSTPSQQNETTAPYVPQTDFPVPPEVQMPTGTDSTAPAPQEGPEGLPTPAL